MKCYNNNINYLKYNLYRMCQTIILLLNKMIMLVLNSNKRYLNGKQKPGKIILQEYKLIK